MRYIVDCSGFYIKRHFIIKELVYCSVDSFESNRFEFKPPTPFNTLSAKEKNIVSYYSNNVHGQDWDSGDLPQSYSNIVLDYLFTNPSVEIYVLNKEKLEIFKNKFVITSKLINFESEMFYHIKSNEKNLKLLDQINRSTSALQRVLSYKRMFLIIENHE